MSCSSLWHVPISFSHSQDIHSQTIGGSFGKHLLLVSTEVFSSANWPPAAAEQPAPCCHMRFSCLCSHLPASIHLPHVTANIRATGSMQAHLLTCQQSWKRVETLRWFSKHTWGRLPWWPSGKHLPCNAGDLGSIPGQGTNKLQGNEAHVPQLLSSYALKPTCRNWSLCATWKDLAWCNEDLMQPKSVNQSIIIEEGIKSFQLVQLVEKMFHTVF